MTNSKSSSKYGRVTKEECKRLRKPGFTAKIGWLEPGRSAGNDHAVQLSRVENRTQSLRTVDYEEKQELRVISPDERRIWTGNTERQDGEA